MVSSLLQLQQRQRSRIMSKINNHILENDLEVECAPEALQHPIDYKHTALILEGYHSERNFLQEPDGDDT